MISGQTDAVAVTRSNPGVTLCKARESRGLSLSEVATQLNLSVSALSCLEVGAFDRLPGHTFARGYIRAYAKLLDLDPNRLVLEFDQISGTDASGSAVHSIGHVDVRTKLSNGFLRLVSFAILAVLLVMAALWWQEQTERRTLPADTLSLEHVEVEGADGTTQIHPLDEPEDQAVELAGNALVLPLTPAMEAAPVAETAETAPVVAPEVVAPGSEPAAPVVQAPAVLPTVEPTPTQDVAAQPGLATGEGLISISFSAPCWVQLTDGNGKVLVSALKRAGETVALTGKQPLELRLGFAKAAQVTFNGQPIDLASFTSGETARLKLGQ